MNKYVKELLVIFPRKSLESAKRIELAMVEPDDAGAAGNELHTGSRENSSPDLWERTTPILDGLTAEDTGKSEDAGAQRIDQIPFGCIPLICLIAIFI